MASPTWQNASKCGRCDAEFGALTRRHHCRKCGTSICSDCAAEEKLPIPEFKLSDPVKWCKQCYDKLDSREREKLRQQLSIPKPEAAGVTTVSKASQSGELPLLHQLAREGKKEELTVHLLSGGVNINEKVKGYSALHFATLAPGESAEVIMVLLSLKADVNITDEEGKTPLHLACYLNWPHKVSTFIETGADCTLLDHKGKSPLDYLLDPKSSRANYSTSHFKLAARLIEAKADIHKSSKPYGPYSRPTTPLHYAARHGDLAIVKLLSERKADVTARDGDGNTPLHMVAHSGSTEVARYLVESKASLFVTNWEGKIPHEIAEDKGNNPLATYLAETKKAIDATKTDEKASEQQDKEKEPVKDIDQVVSGPVSEKNGQFLIAAASNEEFQRACHLVEAGAKVNVAQNGFTPLHYASKANNTKLVSLLLERQASVNAETPDGMTPLLFATQNVKGDNDGSAIRLLLNNKANVNIRVKGKTPLLGALSHDVVSHQVIKLLIDHGADVNVRDKEGWTALTLAKKFQRAKKNLQVVEILQPYQPPSPTLFDWLKLLVVITLLLWLLSPLFSPMVFRLLSVSFALIFVYMYWSDNFPSFALSESKKKETRSDKPKQS